MTKDNSVRWLRGGELANGELIVKGPAHKRGYPTPALGWADDIEVKENEIGVRVIRGGLWTFSGYLVGNPEDVKRCLEAALAGAESPPVPFAGVWGDLVDCAAYADAAARKLGLIQG